jgi:FtsH-binding integral membrane protein
MATATRFVLALNVALLGIAETVRMLDPSEIFLWLPGWVGAIVWVGITILITRATWRGA